MEPNRKTLRRFVVTGRDVLGAVDVGEKMFLNIPEECRVGGSLPVQPGALQARLD
jgi:hypothetical protein